MRRAICLGISLVVLACAGVKVTTTVAPDTDFSQYRSYAQVPPPEGRRGALERVEREIDEEMQARGYFSTNLESADLLIVFRGSTEEKSRRVDAGDPDANYYVVKNYAEGTLEIDIFDQKSSLRVWKGVGRVDVMKAEDLEKDAERAVQAILKELPPSARPGA